MDGRAPMNARERCLGVPAASAAAAAALLLALASCAAQRPPETVSRHASAVVAPKVLASVERVRLVSNDAMVHAESQHRLQRKGGPQLASAGEEQPVLSLQLTCGSDFVFMPSELERPSCLGMDRDGGDYLQQRYTPPDRTLPGCSAAASLTVQGETVWWMREEIRVQNRGDLLAAADRMVDQFIEDWQRARGRPPGGQEKK
jgi:hypothetical protein